MTTTLVALLYVRHLSNTGIRAFLLSREEMTVERMPSNSRHPSLYTKVPPPYGWEHFLSRMSDVPYVKRKARLGSGQDHTMSV